MKAPKYLRSLWFSVKKSHLDNRLQNRTLPPQRPPALIFALAPRDKESLQPTASWAAADYLHESRLQAGME